MADPIVNFFKSTLVGTYSNTDTSFTIATGDGALLPDPAVDGEYNLTIFEGLQVTNSTTFEIVRVTAKSGDVLTVTRQQEGTSALTIGSATHSILMSATKKTFDDIRTDIDNIPLPNQTLNTTSDVAFNSVDVENTFLLPIKTSLPSSGTLGEMFYYSPRETLVFFDGSAFKQIDASYLISLGVATAQVTANGITLAVDIDFVTATATASANDATTAFLSSATRSLGLATATSSGLDAVMAFAGFDVEYLIIAGGGGGPARYVGAGSGAGGLRTSVVGDTSGANSTAESVITVASGDSFTVTVGAGGTGGSQSGGNVGYPGTNGNDSVFGTITSIGGGAGSNASGPTTANSGGSGGGGKRDGYGGAGTANQGFAGGNGSFNVDYGTLAFTAGGGGGASQPGDNGVQGDAGDGGDGLVSTIVSSANASSQSIGEVIGSDVFFAGGGGGGAGFNAVAGTGGKGGGGDGGRHYDGGVPQPGAVNSGGGAGGEGDADTGNGENGGSGVVILRYPSSETIQGGAGLTFSTVTEGANKVTIFKSGTGTISFA